MVCRLEFVLVYVSLQLLTRYLLFITFNDLVWYGHWSFWRVWLVNCRSHVDDCRVACALYVVNRCRDVHAEIFTCSYLNFTFCRTCCECRELYAIGFDLVMHYRDNISTHKNLAMESRHFFRDTDICQDKFIELENDETEYQNKRQQCWHHLKP